MKNVESRRRSSSGFVVLALFAPYSSAPWAVTSRAGVMGGLQDQAAIVQVEFLGAHRAGDLLVREVAAVKPGDPLDPARLDDAVARLLKTGRFLSVQYKIADADGGSKVTFELMERPWVTEIRFEGNSHFSERRLASEVEQRVNQPVDMPAIRDGRQAIIARYRADGYADASVEFDKELLDQSGALVFRIQEGQRVRIREIDFSGNSTLTDRELRRLLASKTAFWFIRSGAFDPDVAEADVARLQNHYQDRGFLDARVAYRTEVMPESAGLRITFAIDEGTRYSIEDIAFCGQSVFSTEELVAATKSRVGQYVQRPTLEADARAIQTRYGELGYIYANARAVRVFSDTPGKVRVTFETQEGDQFRIGTVSVRGNSRTRDKVVRRALDLYPPEDLFNLTEARETERRLLNTRIFTSARVLPVGNQPGVRDAVIDVKEADKAGDFLFGVGVTSNSGLVGSIVLDLHNFDLWDPPWNMAELFKLRAFQGGGQRLRLELQPGTELGRYRIDFTEPYFMDKPIRFDSNLYLFARDRDGYEERRGGSAISFGKRFERGRLRGWTGEIAWRSETVDVDDVDLFAAREIHDVEGNNLQFSLRETLVRDRTDNRLLPTSGDRLRLSYEQFFGDHVFGKTIVDYHWYKTLGVDRFDRKQVLSLSAESGAILGSAPVYEKFYAGGLGSIRGFAFRGVGERDGIDENNVGGDYLLLLGAEYSYPLYGDKLRGHVFLDTGTAGSGTYRAALGTGVRLTLEFFGPLPIELNIAVPISSDAEDDEQVFSFAIGSIF